jgi:hypothetical protein
MIYFDFCVEGVAGCFEEFRGGGVQPDDRLAIGDFLAGVAFEGVGAVVGVGGVDRPGGFDEVVGDEDDGGCAFCE